MEIDGEGKENKNNTMQSELPTLSMVKSKKVSFSLYSLPHLAHVPHIDETDNREQ